MSHEMKEHVSEDEKKGKGEGEGKGKGKKEKKSCRVPNGRTSPKSTLWARHIYLIIKEFAPSLLEKEEIIVAFNHFVDSLAKYDAIFETYIPGRGRKYIYGIVYDKLHPNQNNMLRFKNYPMLWRCPELKIEHQIIFDEIKQSYKPLYDLFKQDVIPALEQKLYNEKIKKMSPIIQREIDHLEQQIENEKIKHRHTIKFLQTEIIYKIEELRKLIEKH